VNWYGVAGGCTHLLTWQPSCLSFSSLPSPLPSLPIPNPSLKPMNGLGSAMVLTFDGGQVEDEADVLAAFGRVSNSDNFQSRL
jgi:hypothetical protein